MKMLTKEAFERASKYMQTSARPIDQALFAFHFENAPADLALAELAKYQNQDGGFGNALEPDQRDPHSSALATCHGLSILQTLGCPAGNEMVQRAVAFLMASFDPEQQTWRIVPPTTNDYPHAPWWHDEAGSLERTFDHFLINPRTWLVRLLHHYDSLVPAPWLAELTEVTVNATEQFDSFDSGGGDDLVQVLSLAETPTLPASMKDRLIGILQPIVVQAVNRDPAAWKTYSIEPLKVAPSPGSIAAPWLADILPQNLDFRIGQQNEDGSWSPVWSWGEGWYPEAWEQARREWSGELTLRYLLVLQAYNRIEL